LSGLLIGLVD